MQEPEGVDMFRVSMKDDPFTKALARVDIRVRIRVAVMVVVYD